MKIRRTYRIFRNKMKENKEKKVQDEGTEKGIYGRKQQEQAILGYILEEEQEGKKLIFPEK
jgi:hypothetical protein